MDLIQVKKRLKTQAIRLSINQMKSKRKLSNIIQPYILQFDQCKIARKSIGNNKNSLISKSIQLCKQSISLKKNSFQKNRKSKVVNILQAYNQKHTQLQTEKTLTIQQNERCNKYGDLARYFLKMKTNPKQNQQFSQFVEKVTLVNPVFGKLSNVTKEVLSRFMEVKLTKKGQYVLMEGMEETNAYFILWGDFVLKKQNVKQKMYLFPGQSLNENAILEQFNGNSNNRYFLPVVSKGRQIAEFTAKSKTQGALIVLNKHHYKQFSKDLITQGLKHDIIMFQRFLKRSFLKKSRYRDTFE